MWTLNGHGRGREGTHQGWNGMENCDLAKIGTSLRIQAGRWRFGAGRPCHPPMDSSFSPPLALLGCTQSVSDLPWQRKHWGNHQQHRGPGEQHSWQLLFCPVQEPGEGFGEPLGRVGVGVFRLRDCPWRGCWEVSPLLPLPLLQLLKKIKRCERKGTESVTEEKCAVLFSTSFTFGPNKLPIQLQVN